MDHGENAHPGEGHESIHGVKRGWLTEIILEQQGIHDLFLLDPADGLPEAPQMEGPHGTRAEAAALRRQQIFFNKPREARGTIRAVEQGRQRAQRQFDHGPAQGIDLDGAPAVAETQPGRQRVQQAAPGFRPLPVHGGQQLCGGKELGRLRGQLHAAAGARPAGGGKILQFPGPQHQPVAVQGRGEALQPFRNPGAPGREISARVIVLGLGKNHVQPLPVPRVAAVQPRQPAAVGRATKRSPGTAGEQLVHLAAEVGSQRVGARGLGKAPDEEKVVVGFEVACQQVRSRDPGRRLGVEDVQSQKAHHKKHQRQRTPEKKALHATAPANCPARSPKGKGASARPGGA